jgi:hypothetical protein
VCLVPFFLGSLSFVIIIWHGGFLFISEKTSE